MPIELPKSYEPSTVEPAIRRRWETGNIFRADARSARPAFSMVIPPPNVTGSLHMGHALNNTLQDILARYKRMDGYEVLWLPGTDHAGIATQNVVEREIAKEGLTRADLGREKFLERVWQWKETYGGRILEQLKRLGCSCDFSRVRFTMDEGLSSAVREVFVRLWEDGLLYRGDYIVNWCPRCGTALSDIEVIYRETAGAFYHIRYPFISGAGGIVVATTRPETMLGDTAVAAHPDDDRHRALIGKKVRLPIAGREIEIIADDYVDPSFGTGLVKITPAHDPNDFLIGRRHNLPLINILNADATMNSAAGEFAGQDRFAARAGVIAKLEADGHLVKVEPHKHNVGHCYRCSTAIEPYVSKQWFIRMKGPAEPAIAAVTTGRIRLHPERWKNDYLQWMENIRDWCISRQIWWGHRIPAWYCVRCQAQSPGDETKGIIVSRTDPAQCPVCGDPNIRQDDDVLDTWFSSALWPFSTLGWPEETDDLKKFYPTSVLSTGFDILTFWVSRMIVMGLKFRGKSSPWTEWSDDDWSRAIPFRDVPIHALIRTETGEKMSKSKGNVIDPLVMMDKFGTDAVRFTLAALAAQGRDIRLSEQRFEGYRHFANKLWNATRYVMMNEGGAAAPTPGGRTGDALCDLCNAWILGRLDETVEGVRGALDGYAFDACARRLYDFIWGDFCDWYIEISKIFLTGPAGSARDQTRACLIHVLKESLKLLHPFMPYITEELWSRITPASGAAYLAIETFPRAAGRVSSASADTAKFSLVIDVIREIRNVRTLYRIPPNRGVEAAVVAGQAGSEAIAWLSAAFPLFERLAKCACVFESAPADSGATVPCVFSGFTVHVHLGGVIDVDRERARIRERLGELSGLIEKNEKRLQDAEFLKNAPEDVVDTMRDKTESYRREKEQLVPHLG